MSTVSRRKFRARLMLRQPVYDKKRTLVDYQWDSCEIEFTSKLSHPTVAGVEVISVLEGAQGIHVALPPEVLERKIEVLDLSARAFNCLCSAGIKTVGDLAEKHPKELLQCRGVGNATIKEYGVALKKLGVTWGRV